MKRFVARVTDDTHRDTAGALVPDGCVELVAPGYGGENRLRWVPPATRGVHVVPTIGTTVRLLVDEGQLRWEPMDGDEGLAEWQQGNYPHRSGMQSRSGTLQVAFDESDDLLHLGLAEAQRRLALWTDSDGLVPVHGLKAILLDIIQAIASSAAHTHTVTVAGVQTGTGTVTATTSAGAGWVPATNAATWVNADEPKTTKLAGV